MAKASRAGATPPCRHLPEEIAIWEILVRLPSKSLLRCRAVCRSWRRATSTRDFLLAHHAHQPSFPIVWGDLVSGSEYDGGTRYGDFFAFDHRAADGKLKPIARFDSSFDLEASCDGLLLLSKGGRTVHRLSICNPVTREHAPVVDLSFVSVLGMYMHRPTGEYRLLLHRMSQLGAIAGSLLPEGKNGCYIFVLGSHQPPRYIQGPEAAGLRVITTCRLRNNLHWFPVLRESETRLVLVFDTTTESFRQMRAPVVPATSDIFEMDDSLGIYNYNDDLKVVDIWVLENYEGEVWVHKYNFKVPVAEIRGQIGGLNGDSYCCIGSVDGDFLLLATHGGWMLYVNTDGELVDSFHHYGLHIYASDLRLKQTLVPHNFFKALEGCDVNASPFL